MTHTTGRSTALSALLALALTAACGSASTSAHATLGSAPVPTTAPKPAVKVAPVRQVTTPAPKPIPSFRTPQAAMRYLTDAWNRGDVTSLKHVTDPSARDLLNDMHREAMNLKLASCTRLDEGDYECVFTHDYPVGYAGNRMDQGKAWMRVGPATRSGWYMTVYEGCG